MTAPGLAALVGALIASVAPAAAQTPPVSGQGAKCLAALTTSSPEAAKAATESNACFILANDVFDAARAQANSTKAAEAEMQGGDVTRRGSGAALGGTVAQGAAVPSVLPAGVAAGTIAAVGTNGGQDAIAALSINPAIWFVADSAVRTLARASRFADVTLFVPISGLTSPVTADAAAGDDNKFRYFGARVRINVHGLAAGDRAFDLVREALREEIVLQGKNVEAVWRLLNGATDVAGCGSAIKTGSRDAIKKACGAPLMMADDEAARIRLAESLREARRIADSKYFGLDLRFDVGDPTLGAVENSRGKFLFAGAALGRRFGGGTAEAPRQHSAGFRARLGVRHAKLDHQDDAEWAIDGGAAFEFARYLGDDELNLSAGLEFRAGSAATELAEQFQSDHGVARVSLNLPVTPGYSLGLSAAAPLWGDTSPTLSVSFNWALLLPGRSAR